MKSSPDLPRRKRHLTSRRASETRPLKAPATSDIPRCKRHLTSRNASKAWPPKALATSDLSRCQRHPTSWSPNFYQSFTEDWPDLYSTDRKNLITNTLLNYFIQYFQTETSVIVLNFASSLLLLDIAVVNHDVSLIGNWKSFTFLFLKNINNMKTI